MLNGMKTLNLLAPGVDEEEMAKKADLVDGKVPASQLPSYVDDAVEYDSVNEFPNPGEQGKIYIALDSGFTYRWSGSEYVQIGGQDLSEYYTRGETDELLEEKQPVGDYATNTALAEGLATKQPVGDYATNSALEEGLAEKQNKGDYATNTALEEGLAGKQDVGDYATNSALEAGLATKQPVGDYATNDALEAGLATKQPAGDYATSAELTAGLAAKQDAVADLDTIRSGAALGATAVQPVDVAGDIEVVAYQTQTPLTVDQLAKAEAGRLAIYKDNMVYTKFTQDGNVVSFQALEHMMANGTYTPAYNVRMRRYTLTLDRSTRMLNDAGYQQGISVADTDANFLAAAEAPVEGGKRIVREMNLAEAMGTKQDTLISGTNIKTINGDSILGAGDLVVQGGESFPQLTLTPTGETEEGFPTGTLSDEDYAIISAVPAGIKLPSLSSETDYTLYTSALPLRGDQSELTSIEYFSLAEDQSVGAFVTFKVDCTTKTWTFGALMFGSQKDTEAALQQVIAIQLDLGLHYQKTLVSGQNIRTINNMSLVGEGNIPLDTLPHVSITTNATSGTIPDGQRSKLDKTDAVAAIEIVEEVEEGETPIIEVYYVYKRNPRSIFAINMDSQSPKILGVNRKTWEWSINATSFGVTEARVQEMINSSVTNAIEGAY